MFSAKGQLLTPKHGGHPVYDAIAGTGSTPSSGGNISFAFTATAGADVFLAISTDRAVTWSSVQYGSNSMTLVDSQLCGNTAGKGSIYWYRLAGGGTGSSLTVSGSQGAGGAWVIANAISYTGVNSVGTAIKNSGSTGNPTSGSITCTGSQVALCAGGQGDSSQVSFASLSSATGGTSRMAALNSSFETNGLFISDATTTTTFGASLSNNMVWATVAVVLS